MDTDVKKSLRGIKALSLIEGVCFFVAGICALLAGNVLGYISGGLMVILGCSSILPVFVGDDGYFYTLGKSLVENDTMEEYGERIEEAKNE